MFMSQIRLPNALASGAFHADLSNCRGANDGGITVAGAMECEMACKHRSLHAVFGAFLPAIIGIRGPDFPYGSHENLGARGSTTGQHRSTLCILRASLRG